MAQHQRREREANKFSIEFLAPPQMMESVLNTEPELLVMLDLADRPDLSMEATIRRVNELHDAPLAVVWSNSGTIQAVARHDDFPWLDVSKGPSLPRQAAAASPIAANQEVTSQMQDSPAGAWTERAVVAVFEQTRLGYSVRAATSLDAETPDEDDDEDVEDLGMQTFRKSRRKR